MKTKLRTILRYLWYIVLLVVLLLLAFSALRRVRERKDPVDIAPKGGHFVDAADAKVFVIENGAKSDPTVVLIHGTGSWGEIWRDTTDVLVKNHFHVVTIDLPPFGYSEKLVGADSFSPEKQAARMAAAISSLKAGKVTLVAHSIGSQPSVEVAATHPELIKKLILVAPALGYPGDPTAPFEFQQAKPTAVISLLFAFKPLRNALISTYGTNPPFIKRIFSSFVYNKESISPHRVDVIKQPMVAKGTTQGYADWLENLLTGADYSLTTHFKNIASLKMPVYLIWGDKDKVTYLWQGEKLHSLIPKSEITVIKNVGHMPFLENVDEFNTALLNYLRK